MGAEERLLRRLREGRGSGGADGPEQHDRVHVRALRRRPAPARCARRSRAPTSAGRSTPRSRRRPRIAARLRPRPVPLDTGEIRRQHAEPGRQQRSELPERVPAEREPRQEHDGLPSPVISNGSSFTAPAPGRPRPATLRARDGRLDVVHADQVGSVCRREDGHRERAFEPSRRVLDASERPRMKPFRDAPTMTAAPSIRSVGTARSSARLCVHGLTEPGSWDRYRFALGDAGEHGRFDPFPEELVHLGHDVVVARSSCIVFGSPSMCISTIPAPGARDDLEGASRRHPPVMSLTARRRRPARPSPPRLRAYRR